MEKIRIYTKYRGHCGPTYIFPVRNIVNDFHHPYEKNWDRIIGIYDFDFGDTLRDSLNRHIDPEIQFFGNPTGRYPDYYDEYGWNFYSKEAMEDIIKDLKTAVEDPDKGEKITEEHADYYRRLVKRLRQVLASAEEYEYILVMGP